MEESQPSTSRSVVEDEPQASPSRFMNEDEPQSSTSRSISDEESEASMSRFADDEESQPSTSSSVDEDEDSIYQKPRPKRKNRVKHVVRNDSSSDEFDQYEGIILKKKRVEIDEEQSRAYRQKATTALIVPSEANKQIEKTILENLEDIQLTWEMDYRVMKYNEQVLNQLFDCGKQDIHQICSLLKQKIQDINGIRKSFIEESAVIRSEQEAVNNQLSEEIEKEINKLREKLVADARRERFQKIWECFEHAMQSFL